MKEVRIVENENAKLLRSEGYNYNFLKSDGFFERWGIKLEDDPCYSPVGPEIADIEISTICNGLDNKPCKFCSPPGTKVNTKDGQVLIEMLKPGDKVLSMVPREDCKSYIVENTIREVYKREYNGELIEIEDEEGNLLSLTPEHTIVLLNGKEIKAEDLKPNDEIVSISEFKHCKHCSENNYYNEVQK